MTPTTMTFITFIKSIDIEITNIECIEYVPTFKWNEIKGNPKLEVGFFGKHLFRLVPAVERLETTYQREVVLFFLILGVFDLCAHDEFLLFIYLLRISLQITIILFVPIICYEETNPTDKLKIEGALIICTFFWDAQLLLHILWPSQHCHF